MVESGAHYEYVLSSDESPIQHHLYLQPYVRSSDLVRLLSSPPDGATRANTNTGDDHSAVIVIRMREWYAVDDADLDGDQTDVLEISVDGDEAPVNVLADFVGNGAIGLHLHDDAATPGETTLAACRTSRPSRSRAASTCSCRPRTRRTTITVTNIPRGDTDRPQTLNVPNWPSSTPQHQRGVHRLSRD